MIWLLVFQLALPNAKLTPGIAHSIRVEDMCPDTKVLNMITPITEAFRDKVLLRYGLLGKGKSYFIDILIPLELGGDIVLKNMWPVPYETRRETLVRKTALEHRLHELVCDGSITLLQAQNLIKTNWVITYNTYFCNSDPTKCPEVQ